MKVLIAEDELVTRLVLTELVQQWGYVPVVVEDGAAAWEVMQQDNPPLLLLLDWEMPKMTGIELCERIREKWVVDQPYILMLTGRTTPADIVEALEKGVDDYIVKPYDKLQLETRLLVGKERLQVLAVSNEEHAAVNKDKDTYQHIFDASLDAFLLYQDGKYIDCNQAAVDLLGCDNKTQVLDSSPSNFSSTKQPDGQLSSNKSSDITALAMEKGSHRFEWEHKRKNGEAFLVDVLLTRVPLNGKHGLHISWQDKTGIEEQQEELRLLAHHDGLTGLPNRALFADRFKQAVAHSKRTKTLLAVGFLDLDNFKPINDNHGHQVGDKILVEVAERIKLSVREGDTVSRQGGDEFTLLLGGLENESQGRQILERTLQSLSKPYQIDDLTHEVTASCGVSMLPEGVIELDALIHQADQAMYKAKSDGKNKLRFYDHG